MTGMSDDDAARLDVWLDVACLFKTRSQAQSACKLGRVVVNGSRAKSHRLVRAGDTIDVNVPGGQRRIVTVREVAQTHVSKALARSLYEDHSPQPSPEEIELRRLQRLAAPPRRARGAGAPKKKERRELTRLKGGEWSNDS
jgi:ribosome-associated heat shock protein Hsp15